VSAPFCLIVNPAAAGGKAGRLAPAVERSLREQGLTVRRVNTRDIDHARELGLAAAREGETVLALSGDGMVGVLADALREVPGARLGVLPGGRGNDLARVLGVPREPLAACAASPRYLPRALDLGVVEDARAGESGRAFVGVASAGFDSDCNRIANEAPAWLGGLAYAYSALRGLLSWKPARFTIELDPPGERYSFSGYSIIVANSPAYGGGMRIAPDALLDDGLLDVVAIERVGKLRFLANLPRVFKGTHVHLDHVKAFRAAAVEISADRPFTMYADGEEIGELPLRLRTAPAAVQLLVPADVPSGGAFSGPAPSRQPPPAGDSSSDAVAPKQPLAGDPPSAAVAPKQPLAGD
jgi:YegS/Rv2252/BmrU family lipid kinase